ncbi:unnamed protein product [Camellia sinensis]
MLTRCRLQFHPLPFLLPIHVTKQPIFHYIQVRPVFHSLFPKNNQSFPSLVNSYLALPNGLSQPTICDLKDCQSLLDSNMDFLSATIQSIDSTDTLQSSQADDIHTLLSAIITNHQTCSDGLQATTPPSSIQNNFLSPSDNGNKLYSVSLTLFKYGYVPKTGKDRWLAERESMFSKNGHLGLEMSSQHRKVYESVSGRKLLQTSGGGQVKVNNMVIVNKDGSGNFMTISDAVAAAPNNTTANTGYVMIYVVGGLYEEYILIAKSKQYMMIVGDGINKTIITGNHSVVDGWTTFSSAAVAVQQFYRECDINGTMDFIFGNTAIVFQNRNVYPRLPILGQFNTITAQGRTDVNQNTSTSIQNCTITAAPDLVANNGTTETYLGRPWKLYSRTVYMQCFLDSLINQLVGLRGPGLLHLTRIMRNTIIEDWDRVLPTGLLGLVTM